MLRAKRPNPADLQLTIVGVRVPLLRCYYEQVRATVAH